MSSRFSVFFALLLSPLFLFGCPVQELGGIEDIPISPTLETVEEGTVLLTGLVIDQQTGEALEDAVVSTFPDTEKLRTNSLGQFVIQEGLDQGQFYQIKVEREGYQEVIATLLASAERNSIQISMVRSDRVLPITFVPETGVFTPTEHLIEVIMVSGDRSSDLVWALHEAPDWLIVSPQEGTLRANPPNQISLALELDGERFGELPANRTSHHGYVEFRDSEDRIAVLNIIAVPAPSGEVNFEVFVEEKELFVGDSLNAEALIRLGEQGLRSAIVAVEITGPEGGLMTSSPVRTNGEGEATFTFEALVPGDYDLLFRLPAYPGVSQVAHILTVQAESDPCAVDNGGCGDFGECSLDEEGEVLCLEIDLCTPDDLGDNYCGVAQYWECENRPFEAPICTDIDECLTGAHDCDLDSEICINQVGAPPFCEPIGFPEVINLAGPLPLSNDPFSTLTFECSKLDCTFSCTLATGGSTFLTDPNCESPFTYPTIDGDYTFTVTATDADGLTGEPAQWEWTVDTVAPVIENLTGPSSPTTSTQAQFTYSCSKDDCVFSCQVSEASQGLLFGPISCPNFFSYPAVNDGTYTFTVIATDEAQNESQPQTWTWTVDREEPEVTNLQGPEGITDETDALFEFGCSKANCTILCSLTGQTQGPLFMEDECSGGTQLYSELSEDVYTFSARAIDGGGNEGPAITREWTINPLPLIENLTGPEGLSNDSGPMFSFECSKSSCTFECLLEGEDTIGPEACNSGVQAYSDLADGDYLFTVRARDGLDVFGPSVSYSFSIDTVAPELSFLETPEDVIVEDWAIFDFECTNKDSCTFECRLNEAFSAGTWEPCTPPLALSDLERGEYEFLIRATDGAGNEASLSYSFDVIPLGWEQVSIGTAHTCAVGTDRSLWCWGNGGDHRLGLGSTINQIGPRLVSDERDWSSVNAGNAHSCAIKTDGTLWCWGLGTNGRLGNGSTATEFTPNQVGSESDWLQVVAAGSHSCGIRAENNTLYCWGNNASGRLGNDDANASNAYYTPDEIGTDWAYLTASMDHTCGLKLDGALYCWGWGNSNRLGMGDTNNRLVPTEVVLTNLNPMLDPDLPWLSVSAGFTHSCAVRADHSLWCWGNGDDGRLGMDSTVPRSRPFMVGVELEWEAVEVGDRHSCAQRLDGTLWCWGFNRTGQLGVESDNQLIPHQVDSRTDWTSFSLGASHSCAIDAENLLYCWGTNQEGRLGLELNDGNKSFPGAMAFSKEVSQIDAGENEGCLVTTEGELYCWGNNRYGQLGVGDRNDRAAPTRVGSISDWVYVVSNLGGDGGAVSTSSGHTCAIRADGRLYCWGLDRSGRLGLGNTSLRTEPAQVSIGSTWSHVTLGWQHTCGIQNDLSLWCWGSSSQGQLGQGTTGVSISSPARVGTAGWIDVTAGRSHSCGIQEDRTLWCWGNTSLGLNTSSTFSTPQKVGTDEDWDRVHAGHNHTCALKTDQTLWCWGNNSSGKLGHSLGGGVPNQVGSDSDWTMVAVGTNHTCGLRSGGRAYCWGSGSHGRLGLGDTADRNTPQQLFGTDWTFITAGGEQTQGLRSSHQGALSWGRNYRDQVSPYVVGKLGDDTGFKRIPTQLEGPEL